MVFFELIAFGLVPGLGFLAGWLFRRFLWAGFLGVALWVVLTVCVFAFDVHGRETPPAFYAYVYLFSLLAWLAGAQIGAKLRRPRPTAR